MGKRILFAYGTLKRGMRANEMLAGARFLGDAVTEPCYRIYDLGEFPALVKDDAAGLPVRGELWEVDDGLLARIDDYEGAPTLFERGPVAISGIQAESYFYRRKVPPGQPSGDRWPAPGHKPSTSFIE